MGRSVRSLLSEKGRQYKHDVCGAVLAARAAKGISNSVAVTITLFAPDRRRRDVDNYAKSTLDALVNAGVLVDDSQVKDLRLKWGEVTKGGKALVEIKPMEPTQ